MKGTGAARNAGNEVIFFFVGKAYGSIWVSGKTGLNL